MKKCCIALLAALAIVGCGTSTSTDGGNTTPDSGTPDSGSGGGGFTIGGVIQTAGAGGLVLGTAGEPNLTIPSSYEPPFAFANKVPSGTAYDVTIVSQATCTGCTCTIVSGASGTVDNANVTSVLVSCAIQLP
jgi:hypothetical protein